MNLNGNLIGSLICFSFAFGLAKAGEYDADTKQAIETAAKAEGENAEAQKENVDNSVSISSGTASVTGFYGGISLGMESLKSKFTDENAPKPENKTPPEPGQAPKKEESAKKKASKTGLLGEVFGGYNCQFGKFVVGLECSIDMRTAKTEAEIGTEKKTSIGIKRTYSFGIAPRFGYMITDSLFGYANVGTVLSKYRLSGKDKADAAAKAISKRSSKASIFIGLGAEQSFGSFFVKGELNKVFNKNVGKIEDEGKKVKVSANSGSYVFKIGGGYRF